MKAQTVNATPEVEVRALVDSWLKAIHAGDVNGIVSHYAPDIVAFDAILKLQFKGVDAYKQHWQACLEMCPGPMTFEIHELEISADDNVAFSHGLTWCGATDENGEQKASWTRMTAGYRKTSGTWKVVHEHFSAPFDMESGKALFDLKP